MKRFLSLLMVICLILCLVSIASAQTASKIQSYIQLLEQKLEMAKANNETDRVANLERMIADNKIRLEQAKQGLLPEQPQPKVIEKVVVKEISSNNSADVDELKEEINVAIANLNAKIDGVDAKVNKGATVQGRAYISWDQDLKNSGATKTNEFGLSRVYIDYKKSLDKDAAVRVTTDIGYESTLSAKWNVYLKYAYFDLGNLQVPYVGLQTLRIGQSATHWIDYMQNYWKFRYVAKTITDNTSFFSSADLGLAALGSLDFSSLMIPGLGRIDYHTTLMNGNGYKISESNSGKDIGINLNSEPLFWGEKDKVTVGIGYLVEDAFDSTSFGGLVQKATAMAAYEFSAPSSGLVFGEYYTAKNSTDGGASVGGQYQVVTDTNLFGRYDNYKKSGSDYNLLIAGVERNWGSNVKIALDYQLQNKNSAEDSKKLYVHTRVKW